MTNGGIIEGFASEDKPRSLPKANSDLSPVTSFPNGSMRVFHGAGTTEEENKAGRWTNIPDGDYPFGGSGATLRAVSLRKPAIEKEARLRPQHFFTFGSGDCSFANASEGFKGWGADEVAPPRSQIFL
jgi:hypothetical protein